MGKINHIVKSNRADRLGGVCVGGVCGEMGKVAGAPGVWGVFSFLPWLLVGTRALIPALFFVTCV